MGLTLTQPDNLTWEEWMCELMCGDPEDDPEEELQTFMDSAGEDYDRTS